MNRTGRIYACCKRSLLEWLTIEGWVSVVQPWHMKEPENLVAALVMKLDAAVVSSLMLKAQEGSRVQSTWEGRLDSDVREEWEQQQQQQHGIATNKSWKQTGKWQRFFSSDIFVSGMPKRNIASVLVGLLPSVTFQEIQSQTSPEFSPEEWHSLDFIVLQVDNNHNSSPCCFDIQPPPLCFT